ncbi:SMI1/KNR4 family protein [Paracoccus sp. IB05]|uniref:SMI1/KNR4 family protein n=1 Tax=Paracoccus sp. IB05 TaxID=2779367 RepID=UPI0018E811AF|nr:SMI1/KNR4 family protein [Paracoccus sp. IB05]MBJ2153774.1 SMI1/KNR4 family protein [Paracoccus sp. IB05]
MKYIFDNEIIKPNPFGETSEERIAHLEGTIGCIFHDQYRNYLKTYNGGKFKNDCFVFSGGVDGRIHGMYGIHDGPDYANLVTRWNLAEYYDIGEKVASESGYFVFASTATGDLLLMHGRDDGVYFLDHENINYEAGNATEINPVKVSNSFNEFVGVLRSD